MLGRRLLFYAHGRGVIIDQQAAQGQGNLSPSPIKRRPADVLDRFHAQSVLLIIHSYDSYVCKYYIYMK